MPRKRPSTAEDHRRALRRQAAAVASELAQKLPAMTGGPDAVGPLVIEIFRKRQHFLHRTGPGLPLVGEVEGPLLAADVLAVEVVMTRAEIREHAREVLHGPRGPGREPVTRDDFEHRLQTLARFVLIGETNEGVTGWRAVWDGNDSKAGLRRRRQSEATDAYRLMLAAMHEGRRNVQSDLFT
ncbi:hypothetical protein [Roseomonas populi]|uniref:Uncharacterized protein n=1 Tax=Roseomonas populi TaxID=3121582 RepID=A0ABT1X7G3_9PROT|nr:hypothetical protein [Roseomonas pecuniae]MCR0984043.1 hypothetical protein [Roseomonas pecuniae]